MYMKTSRKRLFACDCMQNTIESSVYKRSTWRGVIQHTPTQLKQVKYGLSNSRDLECEPVDVVTAALNGRAYRKGLFG